MWIIVAQIFGLILLGENSNGARLSPYFCAYKDDMSYRVNLSVAGSQDWPVPSQGERVAPTVLQDGYERCHTAQGTGHCYTLWGQEPVTSQPFIIKQGCWIVTDKEIACDTDRCNYARSQTYGKLNNTVHFCCCHGNKCNEVEEEVVVEVSTRQSRDQTDVPSQLPSPYAASEDKEAPTRDVIRCAYKQPSWVSANQSMRQDQGQVQPDGKTMHCDRRSNFCFSFYTIEKSNDTQVINLHYQGCWLEDPVCNLSVCTPQEPAHHRRKLGKNSNFCCCTGDFCNNNISNDVVLPRPTTTTTVAARPVFHDPSYKKRTVLISILSVLSVAIIILTSYLVYRYCFHPPEPPACNNNNVAIPQSPAFDIDDLKISCLISRGHFSEVWKGSLSEQDVAVKIYNNKNKQYYYNEKYIYSLPHMERDCILQFYGGEERIVQDGSVQYLLVLQYIPEGTLMNYLKNNTLDWYTMCKMCQSLAKGIAHLHTDVGVGDDFKPTVAHRDLNSRNVLVNADLSLVIADLGFCMTATGSKLIHKGHTENAEQTSLTDVGTLRYMAPELLDGAVNLRDCEASLKQIDMYAFGLVMWEIATRCVDLYQGCPMPEFQLPFQAEAGSPPSFEEMQLLVSRNKVRPKFPEVWKDYNQAIRALKETIEECWDHDAEARLTSMCVEERIVEMKMLWSHDSRNKGVTPTINTALLSQTAPCNRNVYHGNGHTYWGGLGSTSESSPSVIAEGSTSALIINDIHNHVAHQNSETSGSSTIPPSWVNDRRGSFSTSTMETTIAPTPSEHVPSHPKSQNINTQRNQPLPPHQGRNPTTERNTHKRSDEELAVVGNKLLYGKDKRDAEGVQSPMASSDIFDSLTDSLETSLMQNDILNQHRSPQISYLQNQVHPNASQHGDLPPKVVNNPSQRVDNSHPVHQSHNVVPQNTLTPKTKKAKEMGLLGHLALLGKLAFGGKFDGRKTQNDTDRGSVAIKSENGTVYDSIGQRNPVFEPSQSLDTEVRLAQGGTVVRPANLRVKQTGVPLREMSHSNLDKDRRGEGHEADRAEKEPFLNSSEFTRLRGAPYSKSTSDLSPQKSCVQVRLEEEVRRPSTLSLKGHNYSKLRSSQPSASLNSLPAFKGGHRLVKGPDRTKTNGYKMLAKPLNTKAQPGEDMADKITLRNKTPTSEKHGRLSLYDDRLMSDSESVSDENTNIRKCSMSLQQFKSIDETSANVYTDCTC